jgi:hypothetical protein
MITEYLFASASEADLNKIVEGISAGYPNRWSGQNGHYRISSGEVGVLWKETHSEEPIRPLIMVANQEDHQRLFGRFSQLRSDLSPLSAWCHVLNPSQFKTLDNLTCEVDLSGFEASWVGLIIAEASLLAAKPVSELKIAACMATQTYAVARAKALWGKISTADVLERHDNAQRLLKINESSSKRLRSAFDPLWAILTLVSSENSSLVVNGEYRMVVEAIRALQVAKIHKDPDEGLGLRRALSELPESEILLRLPQMTPENRVKEFDRIVNALGEFHERKEASARKNALAFLAAYIATVAAGGSPSLSLAANTANKWPEIIGWAYLIGGIGERVVWTSSFDGLGRFVARELMRPLRLDEPPTCDFALDEAIVLVDKQLSDPLVHLKIKQLRVISISILPGVNIALSISPIASDIRQPPLPPRQSAILSPSDKDFLPALAEALWPYLEPKIGSREQYTRSGSSTEYGRYQKVKTPKRQKSQSSLPLNED